MYGIKASWFGFLGVLLFILAAILGGLQFSEYSHISQLISESYAIGTPYGLQLRYLGFLPSGLFIAAFAYYAVRTLPKSTFTKLGFAGLGIFYGIATIIVSLFPCDKGCDNELVDPSLSQLIHNFTGLLTYIIVPICLLILGIVSRKWPNGKYLSYLGTACGLTAILFVGILSSDLHSKVVGLYQRIVESSVLIWVFVCSFYLRTFHKKQ
ncbi:MAG: DUF998 domain-containing protein [Sphingobacteriia bacterium]|jgi:hypothetical protein